MTQGLDSMAAEAKNLKQRLRKALSRPLQAGALGCLVIFYMGSIAADFLAPVPFDLQERDKALHPPQRLHWQWGGGATGPYVHPLVRKGGIGSPVMENKNKKIRIHFFVEGYSYRFFGLIPSRTHFFGSGDPQTVIHLLGTDRLGRDFLTRLLVGSRVSLSIGPLAVAIAFSIGLLLGGWAGAKGGLFDNILMRLVELLQSIPTFYLLLIFGGLAPGLYGSLRSSLVSGPGVVGSAFKWALPESASSTGTFVVVVVLLAAIGWAGLARVTRGLALSAREEGYVLAARAAGAGTFRVVLFHILPNTIHYSLVAATLAIPGYILMESGLSFLGLGIQEPDASWGNLLAEAQQIVVLTHFPWILIPGLLIFLTVMAFNLVGDAVQEALDPRMSTMDS